MSTKQFIKSIKSRRKAVLSLAILTFCFSGLLGASPAGAVIVDTDRPIHSAPQLDFGQGWIFGVPTSGGFLTWDVTNGIVTPRLTGNLYINNAAGTCGRMQMRYYDSGGFQLATRSGGTVCASDGSLHAWTVDQQRYSSAFVTSVDVVLQVQNSNGTYGDVRSTRYWMN